MALTSTSRRWSGVARRALAVGAVIATATLVTAGPASAHTPKIEAGCKNGVTTLKVELVRYNSSGENTVKVTADGTAVVNTAFETDFADTWEFPGDADHQFVIEVHAWDDPEGKKGFSFTKEKTVEACVEPTTTKPTTTTEPTTTEPTTTTEEPPPSTSESPSTTSEVAPSTSPAPPGGGSGGSGGLADTGASIFIPLGIGALLLLGGAAMLVLVRRRNSSGSSEA